MALGISVLASPPRAVAAPVAITHVTVLLGANPLDDIRNTRRINTVVAGGAVLDRAALDALLGGLEAAGRAP